MAKRSVTPLKTKPAAQDGKKQSSLLNFFSRSTTKQPAKPESKAQLSSDRESLPSPNTSPSREAESTVETAASQAEPAAKKTESLFVDIEDAELAEGVQAEPIKAPVTPAPNASIIKRPLKENNTPITKNNPPSSPTAKLSKKRPNYSEISDDDDEEDVVQSSGTSKRKLKLNRIVADDDSSEDEFVPDADGAESDDDLDKDFVVPDDFEEDKVKPEDELNDDDDDDFIEISSKKKTPVKSNSSLSSKFSSGSSYKSKPAPARAAVTSSRPSSISKGQKFTKENEERYQWLVNICDAEKRPETHPEYDPRTLYIPQSAWTKFTSFEKQYWEIKSKMWDCIVFFKKGKFYELYEKDAHIAHNQFDLKLAGGGRANMQLAGIPEMSFDYWASSFIAKGYKVAKVDQTETGLGKEMREETQKKGKKDVIQRELKCVLTAGTLTEESMLNDDMSTFCIAIKEEIDEHNVNGKKFGVAFIDTSTGLINLTEFTDDSECSKFETLISQVRPKEIIVAKNNLCPLATRILKFNSQNNAIFNTIKPNTEFYDSDTTFEKLSRGEYFKSENYDDLSNWPKVLKQFYEENKTCGFSAFGGLLWYLSSLKLDQSLISIGNVEHYTTIKPKTNLVLDGQTLQNLEIFANSFDGSDKGTLFKLVNRAITPFGKRLMKTWVVHPLLIKSDIEMRLDSVDLLLANGDLKSVIESSLVKLPDLERLLSRVHAGQLKIKDFTRVIEGFEEISKLINMLKTKFELAGTLSSIVKGFPVEIDECLSKWSDAFDRIKANEEGILLLSKGIDQDFDNSTEVIDNLENELMTKLREYRKQYKCQSMEFKDSGKELYTIEMPVSIKVPTSWKQMGASKKTKRYWSPEVEQLSKTMARAKESHRILEESLKTRMYKRFDDDYEVWNKSISLIGRIDCLVSLARTSESIGYPSVRPEFVDGEIGEIEFKELRHPCFNLGVSSSRDFIPNDIKLGGGDNNANIGLLTGANAAGKSTVLRMTCVAVILAQIGCYVPCEYARLVPVDRIMTRLGANDNIMQGKSTFYVELSETKRILDNSTAKSLLVLDELGRGGSSSDGFAIAEAVLHHVATHTQSLGFFATHYASLGQSFTNHPKVKPFRMAILVDDNSKNITFLYKLEEGAAEGSFGMHVAAMCGIDSEIIKVSEIAAKEFEHTSKLKKNGEDLRCVPLGLQSDFSRLLKGGLTNSADGTGEGVMIYDELIQKNALKSIFKIIEGL